MANLLSYIPQFIAILLVFAGIPAFFQFYKFTQDLDQSIGLTIIYEVIIILGGFLTKVWKKLESRWVDRFADWIDRTLQTLFSGYKNEYHKYIVHQHNVFDVMGLNTQGPFNLDLEKIYVQLGVDPTPAHKANTNPIYSLPVSLQSGSHTIWEYISDRDARSTNFVLLGPPGSGKTTLLRHIALTLASPGQHRYKVRAPALLPILLFLRDHANKINQNLNMPLAELIQDQFKNKQIPLPPAGWLEKQIERGKCLIMLDGLDEIADMRARKSLVNWVDQCMAAYWKNCFIVSSRPFGYGSNPLSNATVLQILPFSLKQQEQFVNNWYIANETINSMKDDQNVHAVAMNNATDLLARIRSTKALAELAVNPLLLTMITTVHRYRGKLPGRRVELYAEICEVFLGKRQQVRGLHINLTPAQKSKILSELACYMMFKKIQEISLAEASSIIGKQLASISPRTRQEKFLKNIENASGLLVEIENQRYSFSHLTFQEYLASVYMIEKSLEGRLIERVNDPWWRETILLYCAQTDASKIIRSCLNSLNPTTLSLAIECMHEARFINSEVSLLYENVIEIGVEDPDPERRKLISAAILKKRIT